MPPTTKPKIAPADKVYKYTTPTRGGQSSTTFGSTSRIQDNPAVHQAPETQGESYPRDASAEHQVPLGQGGPDPRDPQAPIDGLFDENQRVALTAARRFLIVGHLLKTLCRRIPYGQSLGFEPESTYGGALQQRMLSSQEKSKLMDASEDILLVIEQLSQQHLIREHEKRADLAGRAGLTERAEIDSEHICKYVANVLFEDARLEP